MAEGIWFVYRAPYEGPSGRRVRRLPDASPLAWFQRLWQTTADEGGFGRESDAYDWVEANLGADLGGRVYGLSSFFCPVDDGDPVPDDGDRVPLWTVRHDPLPASTWQELAELLRRHLYVEGDRHDHIRVDQHSVRAGTDDDEVNLAYYFFDDTLAAASDRAAYLLLEDWRLPVDPGAGGGFHEPAGIQRLTDRHGGTGTTYVVALQPAERWDGLCPLAASALGGVRLPELAAYLRSVRPGSGDPEWPHPLVALRCLVAPADRGIGPSLRRYTRSVGRLTGWDAIKQVGRSAADDHAAAHAALSALLRRPAEWTNTWSEPDVARSVVSVTEHLAQALVHVHELFGYEQWYLFDDVWAAGHPDLAASLLRYASSWDPFAG